MDNMSMEELLSKKEALDNELSEVHERDNQLRAEISELNKKIDEIKYAPFYKWCDSFKTNTYYRYLYESENSFTEIVIFVEEFKREDDRTFAEIHGKTILTILPKNSNTEIETITFDKTSCFGFSGDYSDEQCGYLDYTKFNECDESHFEIAIANAINHLKEENL